MSRLYEALQRSQGETPSASPLATPPLEAPGTQLPGLPIDDTAALDALATQAPPAAAWLTVPPERILRPVPTPEQRLITITNPNSPGAETFRVLATRLAHMRRKRLLKRLLVTSAVGDEGKSVVSVNLALTLARRTGERVLLIEADLRRPTASALLATTQLRGISEWHQHKLALQDAFYQIEGMPLWLLSAGKGIEEPLPLLESDAERGFRGIRLGTAGLHTHAPDGRRNIVIAFMRWRSSGGPGGSYTQADFDTRTELDRKKQAAWVYL